MFRVKIINRRVFQISYCMVFLYEDIHFLIKHSLYSSQSSNMLNQARLRALKVREDHVRNVLDETRKLLLTSITDTTRYKEILIKLMLQALFQVLLFLRPH